MPELTGPVDEEVDEQNEPGSEPPDAAQDGEGDGAGDGPWVTVATFWQPPAAHIARLRLESDGIACALLDENFVATEWLMANALGGIKLQVPATLAARAAGLLAREPADDAATNSQGQPLFDGQTLCPRCGSADIYPVRVARRWAFLSMLLLGAPLPIPARRTRCAACGFEWR